MLEKALDTKTNYKGSKETYENVRKQIEERFGPEEAENYNPYFNCMTYNQWRENNYQVNPKERGFISTVILEKKDKNGKVISKYPRKVVLFCEKQVSKLTN